ncbi:MAG: lysophospholipid acyltransferase family protein [Paracoccus sp. (in: a-proteobacteria)]|nr:lysophospholipid acyltransferase family protein [Paracoccus sp. (in: a-proteobacteria)]
MAEKGLSAPDWLDAPYPVHRVGGWRGWLRVIRRGVPAVGVLVISVPLLLLLRLAERMLSGPRRPLSGPFVQAVCRCVLWAIGLRWRRIGQPMSGPGAVVANHSSWLDIFTLNAALPVFFVAKSEVSTWPGINILTRVTDTHFVTRDPRLAGAQADEFAARTGAGHRLLFFPEGTSSDGLRVLPFKATLFQGFLAPGLPATLAIQPVSARYHAPPGSDPRIYGWWGDMSLGPHILAVLAMPRQGRVEVVLHPPIPVSGETRKTLAQKAEQAIRAELTASRADPPQITP